MLFVYSYGEVCDLGININTLFLIFSLARINARWDWKPHMMQIILKSDWQDKEFEFRLYHSETTEMFDQQRK